MPRKTKRPAEIKDILNNVIRKLEKQGPGKKEEIVDTWRKSVGEKAFHHSRPVSIRQKVLTIEIDSSTWLYELSLKKKGILKNLKKEFGEDKVKDLRFRMGDIT